MKTGEALDVQCPVVTCGALPGAPCSDDRPGFRTYPHTARYDAACQHPLSRLSAGRDSKNDPEIRCGCGRTWPVTPGPSSQLHAAIVSGVTHSE